MSIRIRKAKSRDINWINETYQRIRFAASDFNKEYIAIAEFNGHKCGLGRLVPVHIHNIELGGIYVSEEYRKKGIADAIVLHLVEQNKTTKNVWCLPFEHLRFFYKKYGFDKIQVTSEKVPKEIFSKHEWCNKTYNKEVLLLVKNNEQK